MFLTRCRFQVDPVVEVLLYVVIAELKRNAERARGGQRTVRVERVAEVLRLPTLFEPGRSIGADRDDRKPELRELVFDLAQLAELRIAIGSPAAAVEDEQRTGSTDEFREICGRSVHGADADRRHGCAGL